MGSPCPAMLAWNELGGYIGWSDRKHRPQMKFGGFDDGTVEHRKDAGQQATQPAMSKRIERSRGGRREMRLAVEPDQNSVRSAPTPLSFSDPVIDKKVLIASSSVFSSTE